MGSTLTALQAGSIRIAYTVLIEGYHLILTDGDPSAALTAHSGSDHDGALGGLHVTLQNEQRADPWKPFPSGGSCTLTIKQTSSDDTFGVDTAKRDAGDETILSSTLDRNDTTVTVKSTTGFATSGEAHVGTECFEYSGVGATAFTGVTRGLYNPFDPATGLGMDHRVGYVASSPKLEPLVTQYPRRWVGRWVAVYMHRVSAGVLDVVAESQLVFAGRIDSLEDTVDGTVIDVRHVLDVVREATVGRELWSGKIIAGVYLTAGDAFGLNEDDGGASYNTAANLDVVASGAAGANEMNEGFYSIVDLQNAINTWFQSELAAASIVGSYTLAAQSTNGAVHSFVNWQIPSSAASVSFLFYMPKTVRSFLGFSQAWTGTVSDTLFGSGTADENHSEIAADPFVIRPVSQARTRLTEERGVFVDNFDYMPAKYKPVSSGGEEWGVFLVNEELLVVAQKVADQLRLIRIPGVTSLIPIPGPFGGGVIDYGVAATEHNISHVSIRQIVMLEMTLALALKRFLYSTGTASYNDATFDVLGYGIGLGIPAPLLGGSNAFSNVDLIPGAYLPVVITIDKPTRFVDLFEGELIINGAFLRWKSGHLDVAQWRTPLTSQAEHVLAESNKAAPGGTEDDHRTAARESSDWQRPIVRFMYNRDLTRPLSSDGYQSTFVLEDRVAIDDAGGEGNSITVKCRNVYSDVAGSGAGIESLVPGFLAVWPLFSRPSIILERSIDSRYFEGVSIGDCVSVTDLFARDPDTGARAISVRPAIVTRHWYTPGGVEPSGENPTPAAGGVHLMLLDSNRIKPYGPAAEVDDTVSGGGFTAGYNSGTNTLTCYAHKYSEGLEAADASHFAATYAITIIEIDPADPAGAQTWDRTVSSVSGNDIVISGGTLTGWSGSKRYRVIFDDYTSSVTAQKSYAYQADDADGRIADASAPHQYANGWASLDYTANAASDPVEMIPNSPSADGLSRDVAHDLAATRLLNNLEDYKLAIQSPYLHTDVGAHGVGAGHTGEYKLVCIRPIFLTEAGLSNTVRRELSVAPMIKSIDGSSITCRVSLCAIPPTGDSVYSVDRGTVYSEASFSTSSTSYVISTAAELDIGSVKPSDGVCWLLIEVTEAGYTRGIARCTEGARIL